MFFWFKKKKKDVKKAVTDVNEIINRRILETLSPEHYAVHDILVHKKHLGERS